MNCRWVLADLQAEVVRVEKLVAKLQKKNAILAEGDADDADADALEDAADPEPTAETGGVKEPSHSAHIRPFW